MKSIKMLLAVLRIRTIFDPDPVPDPNKISDKFLLEIVLAEIYSKKVFL
jgi:hypothetical protein